MENTKIKIKIEIEKSNEKATFSPKKNEKDGTFEIVFSHDEKNFLDRIDKIDEAAIKIIYPSIRGAVSEHLEHVSKENFDKKTLSKSKKKKIKINGEIGNFSFNFVKKEGQICPFLKDNQTHKTLFFKDLIIFNILQKLSFRKSADILNRIKHQDEDNLFSASNLHYTAKKETKLINKKIGEKIKYIFKKNNFLENGEPNLQKYKEKSKEKFEEIDEKKINKEFLILKKEISKNLKLKHLLPLIEKGNVPFEEKKNTVNISLDSVWIKKQKKYRNEEIAKTTKEDKTKFVTNSVLHIEKNKKTYVFTEKNNSCILLNLKAFLLENKLMKDNFVFFLDGQKTLYSSIFKKFKWKKISLILDYFHLKKKVAAQLSLGLNKTEKRNEILKKIMIYSWHGLTKEVQKELKKIPKKYIKNVDKITKLKEYFERNYYYIPNYALRKKLGLRNSSNRVEKENDLIFAQRQKNNGMAWSEQGSNALGVLASFSRNKNVEKWLKYNKISFKMTA